MALMHSGMSFVPEKACETVRVQLPSHLGVGIVQSMMSCFGNVVSLKELKGPPGLRGKLQTVSVAFSDSNAAQLVMNAFGEQCQLSHFTVRLSGVPNALCTSTLIEAVAEQAGLEAHLLGQPILQRGLAHGEVLFRFNDEAVALKCVKHFNGCIWSPQGPCIAATLLESNIRGASNSPQVSRRTRCTFAKNLLRWRADASTPHALWPPLSEGLAVDHVGCVSLRNVGKSIHSPPGLAVTPQDEPLWVKSSFGAITDSTCSECTSGANSEAD